MMRLDQFLQKTGVVKRRALAKEICDRGNVELNGRPAKAAHEIKPGDELVVKFREKRCHYKVSDVPTGNVRKDQRETFVELTAEEHFHTP